MLISTVNCQAEMSVDLVSIFNDDVFQLLVSSVTFLSQHSSFRVVEQLLQLLILYQLSLFSVNDKYFQLFTLANTKMIQCI
jgi:hypothetical protein